MSLCTKGDWPDNLQDLVEEVAAGDKDAIDANDDEWLPGVIT